MHLPTTFMAVLSAGALALPAINEIFSTLEKRSTWPWISSFQHGDCTKSHVGTRPKIHDNCLDFSPVTDNVGIYWGTWPYQVGGFEVYRNTKCEGTPISFIERPGFYNKKGTQSCVSQKNHGGSWGSILARY